jgi:transcriptional antiterminator NusG
MQKQWYAVHTYSGHEKKVKTNIERRADTMGLKTKI